MDKLDIPVEPVYEAGWWYETLQEAPREAAASVADLEKAGIPIKAIVIAREAPPLLPVPMPDRQIPTIFPKAGKIALTAGKVLVAGAGAAVAVASVTVAIAGLAIPFMLAAALAIDPRCLCVLQDGTVVEVCTWID